MANQYGYVCGILIVGILQLNLVLSPSFSLFSNLLSSLFAMSAPIEYHDSITPEPYESALTPPELSSFEDYKALIEEWTAMEECYEEAIGRHDDWKTMQARKPRQRN